MSAMLSMAICSKRAVLTGQWSFATGSKVPTMYKECLTVSELTQAIKAKLETSFTALAVKGEISNLKEQASGHLYFTLKDQDAQLSAVLFRGNARHLSCLPKGGDQVIARGEISVYAPRGAYQMIVRELEFLGVGELLLRLHELKAKLERKGWFEAARKKPLPKFPKTIGVVTSPTGSVIQDILHILERRFAGFHLILNPVKVQGEGAAQEIARAIAQFNAHGLADLLIVGRGGGSLEDLWPFNEECVAEAIFQSKIPVISAVGHETDYSIADFVADVRAPTPSAAAEIATQEKAAQLQFLSQSRARLEHAVRTQCKHLKRNLETSLRHPFLAAPEALLHPYLQRIDDAATDLTSCMQRTFMERKLKLQAMQKQLAALSPASQLLTSKQKLNAMERSLASLIRQQIQSKADKLKQLAAHLKGIDPKNLLTKGYCILFQEKKDSVILSSRELTPKESVRLMLHDGTAELTVEEVKPL